jgi:putative SOS response-associated peptidase YedK
MAGLMGLMASDLEIQDALRIERWDAGDWVPHPVVRLTTTMPIAVDRDGVRTAIRARWGFPVGPGRPIGNARDDKLQVSPMWRAMLGKNHALVAATGIYEMTRDEGTKSWWFRRADGAPIVMPALVGVRKFDGVEKTCVTIVTTEPNAFFAAYHNRQVCALGPEDVDAWMEADAEKAMTLLHAPANHEWEAVPVDGRIFKPGRIEREDLQEIGPPVRWTP